MSAGGDASQDARAVHLTVSGRVQGVGFRWFVLREAEASAVVGWVRNLDDGRVEVWAEGRDEALEALVQAVGRGPRHARVDGVERRDEAASGRFRQFGVR